MMRKKIFGFELQKQWDYENGFYLTSHITRIAKMLAHYELYKSIIGLPGHIVECGVFKGASLIQFTTLVILQNLYDKVVKNGLVVFDDFGTVAGETKAIDEFFKEKDVDIEKLTISHVPSFIRKK